MRTQDYYQRRETANLIGLDCAVLPTLQELYYNNRSAESNIYTCAFILCDYRADRSNFMRNVHRRMMEQIYFTL